MSQELASGLIGLGGAIFGAGVAAWTSIRQQSVDAQQERERRDAEARLERHRRDAERVAEQEEAQRDARVTARILLADLLQATNRMRQAKDRYHQYWSPRFRLPTDSWLEHREVVARHMAPEDWSAVSLFYRSLGTVDLQAAGAREEANEPRPHLNDYQSKQIGIALWRADAAQVALETFSGDKTQAQEDQPG